MTLDENILEKLFFSQLESNFQTVPFNDILMTGFEQAWKGVLFNISGNVREHPGGFNRHPELRNAVQ